MAIKEVGINKILNVFQENIPSEILLNGHITNFTNGSTSYKYKNTQYTMFTYYIFTNEINQEVIIKWNKIINNMHKMFYQCNSITSLDLSAFNSSLVIDMSYMLSGCASLISLNLTNFYTSSVTDMSYMFTLYPFKKLDDSMINFIFLIF